MPAMRRFLAMLLSIPVWAIVAAAAGLVAYTAVGFWLVPVLVRGGIEKSAGEMLTRTPTIERVRFNPFTFRLTLERAALGDTAGKPPDVAFERLVVQLDPLSPFHRALVLNEFLLERPALRLSLGRDGSLGLARLFKPLPAPPPARKGDPPTLMVRRFAIDNGYVSWRDSTRTPTFQTSARPIRLELRNFSTRRDSKNAYTFEAQTESQERVAWSGNFQVEPVKSDGHFEVQRLKAGTIDRLLEDLLPFALARGELDFGAAYTFDATAGPSSFGLSDVSIDVRDWAIATDDADTALIVVREAHARGGSLRPERTEFSLGTVAARGASILMWMEPDGHINYEPWATAMAPAPGAAPAPAWTIRADSIALADVAFDFEDRRLKPAARFEVRGGHGSLGDFTTAEGTPFRATVACSLAGGGRATATGTIGLDLSADLQIDARGFALRQIQPYVGTFTNMAVEKGTADAQGRLRLAPPGAGRPMLSFKGEGSSRGFRAIDRKSQTEFLSWGSMHLRGLEADVMPPRYVVRRVEMVRPYARAVVRQDKTLNTQDVMAPPAPLPPAFATVDSTPPPVSIGLVTVKDGYLDFADNTFRPAFATGIQKLEGTIRGLTSAETEGAEVKLDGQVDAYAPASIYGRVDPLRQQGKSDLTLKFQHIDLTSFTPYSGRFAGYRIQKGRLSLDLNYKIDGRHLIGENKVLIEQLQLGERVESEEATKLPVRFAIALLKDRQGNIDLDVPVEGDMDDPKFKIGRIILDILLKLITKAVMSPFALLGAMFGGDTSDHLDVPFAVGSADLPVAQRERLDQLAKGLVEKPALKLEVENRIDVTADSMALVRERLNGRLLGAREAERKRGAPPDTSQVIAPADYARLLSKVYAEAFGSAPKPIKPSGKPKNAAADSVAIAAEARRVHEMEQRLLASLPVESAQVQLLGRQRAERIREAVVVAGPVEPERIYIVAAEGGAPADSDRVLVGLTLTAD